MRAANTALTWRDVKLILAGSARRNDASNTGWEQGALAYGSTTDRYWFNTEYGFGVVDAGAAVELATGWTKLPPFRERSASASPELAIPDPPEDGTAEAASSSVTLGPEVEFVEYASVELRFSHGHRDDMQVDLTSPPARSPSCSRRSRAPTIDWASGALSRTSPTTSGRRSTWARAPRGRGRSASATRPTG